MQHQQHHTQSLAAGALNSNCCFYGIDYFGLGAGANGGNQSAGNLGSGARQQFETPRVRRPTPMRLQPPPPQFSTFPLTFQSLRPPPLPGWGGFGVGGDAENVPPLPYGLQHHQQPTPLETAALRRLQKRPAAEAEAQPVTAMHAAPAAKRIRTAGTMTPPQVPQPPPPPPRSLLAATTAEWVRLSAYQRQSLPPPAAAHQQQPRPQSNDEAPLDLSVRRPDAIVAAGAATAAAATTAAAASASAFDLSTASESVGGMLNPMRLSAIMRAPQTPTSPAAAASASASATSENADADDRDGAGCKGGRQPVTSCHQCRQSFLCLRDLNGHFESEHLRTLLLEFDNTKSWKSSAVDNKELNVEATMVRLENGDTIGFKCPECDYFAKWPTELQKHIMVHSNARPHVCVVCGCTYKWKWDLGRHFDKSHESGEMPNPYKKNTVKPAVASHSSNVFQTSFTAASCVQTPLHHQPQLPAFGMPSSSSSSWKVPTLPTSGLGMFRAEQPPQHQSQPETFDVTPGSDQRQLHQWSQNSSGDGQQTAEGPRQLTCPICGAKARWKSELKSHLINHSNFKPFRCKFCSYRSKWKWDVVKHLKRCTGKKTALGGELDNKEIQAFVIYDPPDPELYSNEAEAILYADSVARANTDSDAEKYSSSSSGSSHDSTQPRPQQQQQEADADDTTGSPKLFLQTSTPMAGGSAPPVAAGAAAAAPIVAGCAKLRLLPCGVCRHVSRSSADLADHMRSEHRN